MNFGSIFFIQIVITILFSVCAVIYDVRKNFIPDLLNYLLILFGLISNLFLTLVSANLKFILASFISMVITYVITYLLWKLHMWGGGDVKLFTGIATAIPIGLNIDFLNIYPRLSVYPFAFSVVINSVLVSFPFILIFVMHYIIKNDVFKTKIDFAFNMLNLDSLKYLLNSSLNKRILIKDLKEGNIINNYYFNDERVIQLINDVDGNLEVYEDKSDSNFRYYFKSLSAGGITEKDMYLIKIMSAQGIISKDISIKVSYPYTPAIFVGLLIAIFYGDIIVLFTKNLVMVI